MSVKFDKANDSNNGDWIRADDDTALVPTFPFSIALWVRLDANVAGTETIWFYGDKDHAVRYFVLEARLISGSTKLLARLVNETGPTPIVSYSAAVSIGDWHLVTVVATEEDDEVTLKLYLDDETVLSSSTSSVVSPNISDYDRFALGRWAGSSGSTKPCSFLAEQVAIWNTERSSTDHNKMFADTLNGETVRRPPTIVSPSPDIGHWVLAGHRRHALRLHNTQNDPNEGDLRNNVSGKPDAELGNGSVEPVWSVKTPAVLYNDTETTGIDKRPRKKPTGRANPHFYFFAKPELSAPWTTRDPGTQGIWKHPNMSVMARVPYDPLDDDKYAPPQYEDQSYHPTSYLTQIAKRVADWFEYQGFKNNTGSGGSGQSKGQYEGCVFIQSLGNQNAGTGTLGRDKQDDPPGAPPAGAGLGIPLEMHPKDDVTDTPEPTYPWATWFRANGEALVKEYSEEFWPLLKAELDRRKLAYPKRLHWDDENSPLPGRVVGDPNHPEDPIVGTFPTQLEDGRANNILGDPPPADPGEVIADGKALQDIWGSGNAWNTYNPQKAAYDTSDVNLDWRVWYLGWMRMIRQDALDKAIMTPAANEFPEMKWSNYNDYVADNPKYPHYFHHPKDAVVTPLSSIPADFSAPVLYSNTNWDRLRIAGFGKSPQIVQWEIWNRGIEACRNTSSGTPFVPWVCNVGYTADPNPVGTSYPYTTLSVDLRWLLRRCWQRGANEFIVWVEEDAADGDLDKTYKECEDLVKWAKCQTKGQGKNCR